MARATYHLNITICPTHNATDIQVAVDNIACTRNKVFHDSIALKIPK